MAVKEFNPDSGDSSYTMGIVDLLLECVELSYRPDAGGVRLREDIHNAHGSHYIKVGSHSRENGGGSSVLSLSPALSRLLDVLVNLAQTGPADNAGSAGIRASKSSQSKPNGHSRSRTLSSDWLPDEVWDKGNNKVKDLEAVQMLQDIFLKAESRELQAEVLNRMFKIFSSHLENYKLCQQLRTVPLLILNMGGFPPSLNEIILKILEYAVTVVNCIPDQELLSLCCLLQQPISSELKHAILSFFVKLLSFDQQYKKVLREVGVLEILLDDLKQHKFLLGPDQPSIDSSQLERKSSSSIFKKHLDSKDAILSSPKLLESSSGKFPLFEVEGTIAVAWDCMVALLKKADANQAAFRSANGVTIVLPFLASNIHRPGVLRVLSCLIIEDATQVHPEELGVLVEVLKSGLVTSVSGSQYRLLSDAKCDTFGAMWRILGVNKSAQRVFGEATGFSLLLTTLHSFQSDGEGMVQSSIMVYIKVFSYLLRAVTTGAQVIQLLLELSLELVIPLFLTSETVASSDIIETGSAGFLLTTPEGSFIPDNERLEVLNLIEKLARAGSFNQENLTSVGCVELLLETIYPFLLGSSSLVSHALKVVEVLGAYRLSASEVRVLIRYILQMRLMNSGCSLVDLMEKLILMENMASENVSLAPFVEMNMSKIGHASIQVSLGERSWPPAAGYSFVCWFQFRNFLRSQTKESDASKAGSSKKRNTASGLQSGAQVLRIFSVAATDNGNTLYAELYLQDDGVLTLATSNTCSLSFSGLELEEGRWHHLAVVHSKPNALAGLFQSSVAYLYLDGKLRHTGKLGYSPSPFGKPMQVTVGTPVTCSRISDLSWKLRCCYLFEEVLTLGSICFMYILGRGYRGLFQDTDLLRFVPNQACGGGSMAILDSLDKDLPLASNMQRPESANKQGSSKADCKAFRASGTFSMLNLVDPMSAAASPIGGIPRFGRLHGDVYICRQCVIGDSIRPVGGMAVVLALVEAAETRDMLHMALTLLACALHQNPQNVRNMQKYRGYHLLALFLHRRMSLFDMSSLEIFFQIAACEASFSEPKRLENYPSTLSPAANIQETSFENLGLSKMRDEFSSVGSHGDMDDYSAPKDSFSHISELENADMPAETSNCIVLSNADMVEHVLLDWTLWVTAPVSVQIALLVFLEHLVSMHWYTNHNLTILRRINLVQHLLVTLQRGDVEVPVLEKLVVLLGVILKDGFLASELEHVVRFVIMTFDPPELTSQNQIMQESMGKHVIVRNMLLEMLIDLQVTIKSEELREQWHKVVSSKLITYFLDEAVHPTSMRWIMTLLGVCLVSSPTFASKFRTSGGYQSLARVLPSFYDSPDIYYILFCLIFGKTVYPRLPEVRMLDFHALMPSDGSYGELKFVELLDSVIAMAKSTFVRLCMQSMVAHQTGNLSQVAACLVAELADDNANMAGELQGEALMHKTYATLLMGGQASASAAATSVLRFMVDLAKMCPPFSAVCRRAEFLESCIDLYFSCVRAAHAVKMTKGLSVKTEEKIPNDCDDTSSSQNTFSSLPREQEHSVKTSISIGSFPQGQVSTSSDDMPVTPDNMAFDKTETSISQKKLGKPAEDARAVRILDGEAVDQVSTAASSTREFSFCDFTNTVDTSHQEDYQSSASFTIFDSPIISEKSSTGIHLTPSSSPVIALTSWLGSSRYNESKAHSVTTPSIESSFSMSEHDPSSDLKSESQGQFATNEFFTVNLKLLLEIDDSGYGGGPCSAGATAVLDFMAEVLSDFVTEQMKAGQIIESILESVPLYVDAESVLIFQGLCLSRLMNFLERRLLRDDEENEKKLDKSRWSSNLDALCLMIVDRAYMGAFPQPVGVLRTLEFLFSMLQLANKDGRIEETAPTGKGLLYITRGSRPLDAYIHAILKNMNRMILFCFLPSFLINIGEEDLASRLGLQIEQKKRFTVALEDLLVSKPNQGLHLNVLHGGFDRLLTESLSAFFEWFHSTEQAVSKVLEHCAAIMWVQYIAGSAKFPGERIKDMDSCRKREMGRRSQDTSRLDQRHWEQINERRYALELVRDAMSTELRVVRQDKYGWVLHAESEWQTHLQELVHKRGIFPLSKSSVNEDPEWQLCPIEVFKKSVYTRDGASSSAGWNDDRASSINEASLHSASEFGVKSASESVPQAESIQGQSDLGSPRQSSSMKIDEVKVTDDKLDKEFNDNGEYLIRPYLEPLEKIKFRYNCERVVGLDKHDGIFLIGELSLYVIENFYIDDSGRICEGMYMLGGRARAYNGGAWGKEKVCSTGNVPHPWHMWKLNSVHEILKRDYQLRPVAIELFSMDGCNDLLVFHKKEREEVFKILVALNLPRSSMLDTTFSGSMKQESNEGSRLFKIMAKSFSKRWQMDEEISNFQYLMHLNTLAGRGYSDLTQYPVFPWVLADYESENLALSDPKTFRRLDKPMGCQTLEGEDEFKKRYESWDDPEVPKFHYGSHYSSAGIVLFYLLRLPPFSLENQKLQGGQFDHADRLFNSVRDTWLSAAGKGNTSDVKELIPEFFYMPEFLENRFNLDLEEKQSGEKMIVRIAGNSIDIGRSLSNHMV
ncbi:similar to BEACH-DOMAIN HOMOLOG A1 [Actinidia rufa]|uniref:Similar to BEACH-DOMAIN HOMOLOG A1 n=1 Tax=Actinidia rufa TaxID=165716 RepID=A0A7J0H9U7_9ERIC|nr:similar to BEACH-DOMAIN HOMOLOG A1 [Actinidia rufa]